MDNFNITKWNRARYLKESKIEEYGEYKSQEVNLKKELDSQFSNYRPFISLGMYGGDRPDTDPLKGKGFGSITFSVREELDPNDWNKALKWVEDKGFEIESESNWYEMDIDDESDVSSYHPQREVRNMAKNHGYDDDTSTLASSVMSVEIDDDSQCSESESEEEFEFEVGF